MRIVSLAPSATEIVFALDLGDRLVGVSHDSDWPAEARTLPVVTRPAGGRAAELAAGPSGEAAAPPVAAGRPASRPLGSPVAAVSADPLRTPIEVDEDALADLRPDLVIAPALRDITAPRPGGLRAAVAELGHEAELLALDPTSIEGVLHSIATVGAMTRAEAAGLRLVERLRGRLGRLERQVQRRRERGRRPARVVALEATDPPVAAGLWIPEQVRRAGGWEILGREGEPAAPTTWQAIRDVDPEAIVLMPRGFHLADAMAAWGARARPEGWDELEAVRRGQVFAVDAASFFGRPGPRIVEGIALLAEILDPDAFAEASPIGSWSPLD